VVTRVERRNEIFLGGTRFHIKGAIQSEMISVFPAKVTIGDITKDSQPRASLLGLSDWRSGIGLYRSEAAATVDRAWWSTLDLRHKNNLVLQRLANITAAGPATDIGILVEFNDAIYASFGNSLRKYDNGGDNWTTVAHTLPGTATDALVVRLQGTVYFIVAHTTGYSYSSDGTTWVDDTEDMIYLAYWDEKVWGIDETGQLKFSTFIDVGTWANDAQLPLPNGYATDLFEGKDTSGNSILLCMTRSGLYAHNFDTGKFEATQFTLPRHPNNGKGTTRWRDNLYIPAGNAVYRYTDGTSSAVVSIVGPDKDDGLPSAARGTITQLLSSHNELIALLDTTTAPAAVDLYAGGESPVVEPSTGINYVLGWDELGWQVLWDSATAGQAMTYGLVASAYGSTYRLWWAHNQRVYFMDLATDVTNPDQLTTIDYAASGTHETPWFNFGQDDIEKLGAVLDLVVGSITTTEKITVSYGLDLSTTYTEADVIDVQPTDGHVRITFPSATQPKGIKFQWIRFKFDFARGGTTTLTPKLHGASFTFRKKLPLKLGFTTTIDMNNDSDGLSPQAQRYALRRLMEEGELKEFTYRSDTIDSDEWRTYYVDIISASNMERTGLDETGESRISLAEL